MSKDGAWDLVLSLVGFSSMKLKKLFDLAVEAGIAADPRSEAVIRKSLKRVEERHKRLEGKEREHIDAERTWNPYLDSPIPN